VLTAYLPFSPLLRYNLNSDARNLDAITSAEAGGQVAGGGVDHAARKVAKSPLP
jgi:hypothetical protein